MSGRLGFRRWLREGSRMPGFFLKPGLQELKQWGAGRGGHWESGHLGSIPSSIVGEEGQRGWELESRTRTHRFPSQLWGGERL